MRAAPASGAYPLCGSSPTSTKYHYTSRWDTLESLTYERTDTYFDLHVPGVEHYLAEGIWHHNTGKSRAELERLNALALHRPYAGMRGLILRKTRSSLTQSALVTFNKEVRPQAHGAVFRTQEQEYRYPNGSTIVVGGLDKDIKVMSSQYDVIYVQEATELSEAEWEALSTRLRNGVMPYQQLMGDCNPGPPTHWIKQRAGSGRLTLLESRHEDNPSVWDLARNCPTEAGTAYLAKLDALTGVRYQRLRRGIWAAAEGIVYEGWDPAVHLIDAFAVPRAWPRYWVVDFGYTNPFVWQCWAEDSDGRLYLEREIYRTQTIVEDHARAILALTAGEPRPRALICDHDAEDRATLERYLSLRTTAAHKAVSPGIQAVAARLRPQGDGRPRLFLLRDTCQSLDPALREARKPACTAEEFEGYVWDTGTGRRSGEEPLKRDDHGLDCTRYLVAFHDLGGHAKPVAPLSLGQQSRWNLNLSVPSGSEE